jgi:hypothetical protein
MACHSILRALLPSMPARGGRNPVLLMLEPFGEADQWSRQRPGLRKAVDVDGNRTPAPLLQVIKRDRLGAGEGMRGGYRSVLGVRRTSQRTPQAAHVHICRLDSSTSIATLVLV